MCSTDKTSIYKPFLLVLLDQARTNADGLLSNAQQRLEEAEDREALLHTREERADS
jgi:hypothetical protein